MVSPPSAFEKTDGYEAEKAISLSYSLCPLLTTQIALKVKKILPVLDVLGLLHQEALALKKGIGILGLGRLNRHVVESGKK